MLTADLALADYFDAVVAIGIAPKTAANWVTGEFSRLLNQHAAEGLRASGVALSPEGLAQLISGVEGGPVSAANAKTVLAEVFLSGELPTAAVDRLDWPQVGGTPPPSVLRSEAVSPSSRRRSRNIAGKAALRVSRRPGHEAHRRPRRCPHGQRGARAAA